MRQVLMVVIHDMRFTFIVFSSVCTVIRGVTIFSNGVIMLSYMLFHQIPLCWWNQGGQINVVKGFSLDKRIQNNRWLSDTRKAYQSY